MYLVVLLKDGHRKELFRYDSPHDFRTDYPTIKIRIVGLIIYVYEELEIQT